MKPSSQDRITPVVYLNNLQAQLRDVIHGRQTYRENYGQGYCAWVVDACCYPLITCHKSHGDGIYCQKHKRIYNSFSN